MPTKDAPFLPRNIDSTKVVANAVALFDASDAYAPSGLIHQ